MFAVLRYHTVRCATGAAMLAALLGTASVAIAGSGKATLPAQSPAAAPTPTPSPAPAASPLTVRPHPTEAGTTMLHWSGKVDAHMPVLLAAAFHEHRQTSFRFVLVLHSGGGSVQAGEQVISVLRSIRVTHRLDTEVRNGNVCGSMCVFIYLQGETRTAAPASLWLFHEVTRLPTPDAQVMVIDRAASDRLFAKYYPVAGVSPAWTQQMKSLIANSDYWLSGRDLVDAGSGIVTALLGNTQARVLKVAGADNK
jgi:hypothetical protein